jgi:anti-sigma factor RsiW
MSFEITEITTIKKYLLGDLPELEKERIEKWYFADGRAVDEVWAAFGEMAEERLSGALSESEARRFDQRLQSSPALREMFEDEKALRDYAARITAGVSRQVKSDDPAAGGWRRIHVTFFKAPRLMLVSVVALITLGALGAWFGSGYRLMAPGSQNPADSQQAKTQEQKELGSVAQPTVDSQRPPGSGRHANDGSAEGEKSPTSQPDQSKSAPGTSGKTTATFLLLAAGTRGEENYPTLEISTRTETVQLELESPTDDCAVYSAVLQTESGEELLRWQRLRTRRDNSKLKVARIRVPARSLKNASYVMRLECPSSLNNPASVAQYRFKLKKNIS